MQVKHDFIVVGSGATASQAAQTLAEAGATVAMLDVGIRDEFYRHLIPDKDFTSIRNEDPEQHLFFLGKDFEGIPWDASRVGSQLTPPRGHLIRMASELIPLRSETFSPMESLAYGGLGGGWGVGCYVFSDAELRAMGLNAASMELPYRIVASRIGISGEKDDGGPYALRYLEDIQPAPPLETSLRGVFRAYLGKRALLNAQGFFLGRAALALLTNDLGDRRRTSLSDMDFWSDAGRSAYRSWMTVEALQRNTHLDYLPHRLVLTYREEAKGVEVTALRTDTKEKETFFCRRLILSPGVLGTARIVLRSAGRAGVRLPLICNPHTYIPCLQLRMLGKDMERKKTSFSQLVLFHDEHGDNLDVAMAALFSYRSLLLFKLAKEAPLGFRDARILMHYLQTAFTIAGIHHPEKPSATKFVHLSESAHSPTGDLLEAQYLLSEREEAVISSREKQMRWALRKLGCHALKTVRTPHGASIHYAGVLPYSQDGRKFTLLASGRLAGSANVYVADGSGFTYLPAKGLTLTLMANAHRVALNALRHA